MSKINKIKIQFNRDMDGKYWKVTKKSFLRWKIIKREKITREEWLEGNKK